MDTHRLIILFGFLIPGIAFGQLSLERKAQNSLLKGKWEKSRNQLTKALKKEPVNATARFVFSAYYFTPGNPSFHIDSAYLHTLQALSDYTLASDKQRDKMKRFPLDSGLLISRRKAIDSAAFERAKQLNTEAGYIDFITRFTTARQLERAAELRDEVAYVDALKENTYESFLAFLTKYPNAARASEARDRYEKLLFEEKTKDKKLASYRTFIEQYPESPYRDESEFQIFQISTASGKPETFTDFIRRHPNSKLVSRAKNILYHLLKEEERPIPSSLLSDSIKAIRQLEQGYLVPFSKDGKFGFMNAEGKEIIKAFAREISPEYLCGNITDELLVTENKIIARNGSELYSGNVKAFDDLGYGFILVSGKNCSALIHKSGFTLDDCILDAKVLEGSFLAIKKANRWTLKTFTGRVLPVGDFEDVDSFNDVILVKQYGKYKLIHREVLALSADQISPEFSRPYDDVKRWNDHVLWASLDNNQALLSKELKERIAFGRKEIKPSFFGAVSKSTSGYRLWNSSVGESATYSDVRIQKPWIGVKSNAKWNLLDLQFKPINRVPFDSLFFNGPLSMAVKGDSIWAYVSYNTFIPLGSSTKIQFLPGKDSTYFLLVEEGEMKSVYASNGAKLFTVNFDKIEFAGENLFFATKKDKRGLINLQGKPVASPEYDAMGNLLQGTIPVLKDKKFGFLDVIRQKEIKPIYEKNIIRFNTDFLIASRDGHYGIIDWSNKTILPFEYEEIRYWNDSTALVKRNFQWIIYNFIEKKILADRIKDFRSIGDSEREKLLIIHQENNYGVISNVRGVILPATYSDIVNLGSKTQALYFTEKHVEEASIYVVIYYDDKGNLLRRQVFEADDYDRIYCTRN